MEKQSGYFVYYERNEAMQNYMITIKQEEPEEVKPEVDRAAKRFRNVVAEKKEELHHKQTMGMLYGTSVAMLLIVTIIGVTMLNNYEKMQSMEKVLNDISTQMVNEEEKEIEILDKGEKEIADAEEPLEAEIADEEIQEKELQAPKREEEASSKESEEIETNEAMAQTQSAISDNSIILNAQQTSSEAVIIPTQYCIEKGDTLANISLKFYGNKNMIDTICELNHIENRDNINYGDNIILP